MKSLVLFVCWLALIGLVCSDETLTSTENEDIDPFVTKRSVAQFGLLIYRYTGRSAFDYNGYGCWCGKGGRGRPVDAVDRCCQRHDRCYDGLIARKTCNRWQVYFKNYRHRGLKCKTGWGTSRCGRSLCSCDVTAVKCFRRNRFNNRYKKWNKNSC